MRGIPGIGERLKRVRSALAKTQVEMASAVGAKPRSWQEYESEKTTPGSSVIAGLVALGFNANWILSGTGEMRHMAGAVGESSADYGPFLRLPARQAPIAAVQFQAEWLEAQGIQAKDLVQLAMPDDGMQPTIGSGDLVVYDSAQEEVTRSGLWAYVDAKSPTVGRIQPRPDSRLLITPDNALYTRHELEASSVSVLGRVIWIGKVVR